MRAFRLLVLCGSAALLSGCGGGPDIAPVSGRVTMDGKPLANVYVTFQPNPGKDVENAGRGSVGVTDADGRFTLTYEGGRSGAVVGKHIVRITPVQPEDNVPETQDTTLTGSIDGVVTPDRPAKRQIGATPVEIPEDWNVSSRREFTVPADGTDQANFDIVTGRGHHR
ncbi:MAG TPA: hypothetical protein VFG68_04375 [Fimbriiglobus sp.]|nr:hypothetical protein [Fimbriiglobus sp.]